jgi:hypothetical protein
MFQSQIDIRHEILKTLAELNRPATSPEISAAIWFRCRVDGVRSDVYETVRHEIRVMVIEGILEVDTSQERKYEPYLKVADILTLLAYITE